MAGITPRRSTRISHMHTPKMSERKKGLFQSICEVPGSPQGSLTQHRRLPVVDSESDSEGYDLGIISTLDSSSCDENEGQLKTPERSFLRGTRLQTKVILKENQELKNFIKSPYTLNKYQTKYLCAESKCAGSSSTPGTPHVHNHPGTPSSTHSCASIQTNSSTSSKARKSLASLIADTESCSSSLKDLNFDTDSSTDSKENTPTKTIRRSSRRHKMTPKFQSFKGILVEQKKNELKTASPMQNVSVCLTKMDFADIISPTQMLKTPHNTTEVKLSPPKLGHNRRSVVEIDESPESNCDSEKSNKRIRNDSSSDQGPNSKHPKLDQAAISKARVSLFNSDRLKEILSAKSFYGKPNPELNKSVVTKISRAIETANSHPKRSFAHAHTDRRRRKPGQINLGVKHRIRKPKINKNSIVYMRGTSVTNKVQTPPTKPDATVNTTMNNTLLSLNSSQELETEKADPFDKEKETIEALLSQWTEEEVPESELITKATPKPQLTCFTASVMEETNQIFQPVNIVSVPLSQSKDDVIELGLKTPTKHITNMGQGSGAVQDVPMSEESGFSCDQSRGGQLLPVDGGYIYVQENEIPVQDGLPDIDAIDKELEMLDEQILKMAQRNNINANAVLASTEVDLPNNVSGSVTSNDGNVSKLFSIFNKPNPGTSSPSSKENQPSGSDDKKKHLLKNAGDQYVIDAGQKKFGATQCAECSVIYQIGDPQDEYDHLMHHNATNVLRFNGWKEECVVGVWGSGRVVRVRGTGAGWRRVRELLLRVVHPQLGYCGELPAAEQRYTAYLYIEKKQIIGCCLVEPRTKAYKFLPGDPDCCSVEDYPVKCGVSRVWTALGNRRRGVARRLLDCARASLLLGTALRPLELAFSSPTPTGKAFATAYCGTPNFFVYLD